MKVSVGSCLLALTSIVTSKVALPAEPLVFNTSQLEGLSPNLKFPGSLVSVPPDRVQAAGPPPRPTDDWGIAVCRGYKLTMACTQNAEDAAKWVTPINSPWDGDLVEEMKTWGYKDDSNAPDVDSECEFEELDLHRALGELGIDHRTVGKQGPNKCYRILHKDGPAILRSSTGELPEVASQRYVVDGKTYRATDAAFTIGVNAPSGVIYFLQRWGPEWGARKTWKNFEPPKDELPALRSASDIAWGLWNRSPVEDINNIKYFFAIMVVNDETEEIIERAMAEKIPGEEQPLVQPWPGTEFSTSEEAGQALLGSPNGSAMGYFLAQHKQQLGGNKYISKIHVFCNDGSYPTHHMAFFVEDAPPPSSEGLVDTRAEKVEYSPEILRPSVDGKNIVRSHVFRAKL